MRARLPTIAFRLVVLTAVWLLGTATFTLAQETTTQPTTAPSTASGQTETQPEEAGPLVVPDVRGLPYVFAKGVLEDAGFGWKVKGKVEGYAVNLVAKQSVKPGTRVVDNGAPTVLLYLEKNPDYEERGLPEDASPFPGTKLLLVTGATPTAAETALPETDTDSAPAETGEEPATTGADTATGTDGAGTATETTPAETTAPAETAAPADTQPAAQPAPVPAKPASATPRKRVPAFVVPGAPREPLDEIPLPLRAKHLKARLANEDALTSTVLRFWQYQHAWIVTGAKFGWWHGAEALRILIGVDRAAQRRWHTGYQSEQVARQALAEVLRKSGK